VQPPGTLRANRAQPGQSCVTDSNPAAAMANPHTHTPTNPCSPKRNRSPFQDAAWLLLQKQSGPGLPEQAKADISFVADQAGASSWSLLQAAPNPKRPGLGHQRAACTNISIIWPTLNHQYSR